MLLATQEFRGKNSGVHILVDGRPVALVKMNSPYVAYSLTVMFQPQCSKNLLTIGKTD